MKIDMLEMSQHVEKLYNEYRNHGDRKHLLWVMHPRQYHYLKDRFRESKIQTGDFPEILKIPAVVTHVWRQYPVIVLQMQNPEQVDT